MLQAQSYGVFTDNSRHVTIRCSVLMREATGETSPLILAFTAILVIGDILQLRIMKLASTENAILLFENRFNRAIGRMTMRDVLTE